MERDNQRSKVYAAEKVLWEEAKYFSSLKEIRIYVKKILKTKWAIKRWGEVYHVIEVEDGRGRKRAGGTRQLSSASLSKLYALLLELTEVSSFFYRRDN
jgi:hypothetical protein